MLQLSALDVLLFTLLTFTHHNCLVNSSEALRNTQQQEKPSFHSGYILKVQLFLH